MSKETLTLGATSTYVKNWGVWAMFRELAQNVLDNNGEINHFKNKDDETYTLVFTNKGIIERSNLLYGGTTKAEDPSTRGKHGDGLKNALLVALRENFTITIENNGELWQPLFIESKVFNTQVLAIDISKLDHGYGDVVITVSGLIKADIDTCLNRYIGSTDDVELIFGDEHMGYAFENTLDKPALFVGGLFVGNMPKPSWEDAEYAYSYNMPPSLVPLDRDRTAIDDYLIQEIIASILISTDRIDIMLDMSDKDNLDIRGYSRYIRGGSDYYKGTEYTFSQILAQKAMDQFYEINGENAYPISKGLRVKYRDFLTSQGLKWVIMSEAFFRMTTKEMYRNHDRTKMPDLNPIKFLREVLGAKKYSLRGDARKKVEDRLDFYLKYTEVDDVK